jgi:alpha-D-ribose 1-methylphosphonate 5-triphosphate synthase subunit PhnI
MSMALVDRALRAAELGEAADSPANDHEFVLYHSDNVEASGFVQHLKLPHYVDFQANLELVRRMRHELAQQQQQARHAAGDDTSAAAMHDGAPTTRAAAASSLDEAIAS